MDEKEIKMKKIAVVLSGCGVYDGSEIHEAVITLLELKKQGADPIMGRKLKGIFHKVGLDNIEYGILGGQWHMDINDENSTTEWKMILEDLKYLIPRDDLNRWQQIDANARSDGERVLYVPTFYALGHVPTK